MKFIVSSSDLFKQLSTINGVITTNPVVPILENFLLEIDRDKLIVTASDLQTSIAVELDIDSKGEGAIAVPAKILLETLKNLPEQPVTFSIDQQTYSVEIASDNGHYKLAGENPMDFPKPLDIDNAETINIPTVVLSKAISMTIFATSNDELRPAMTGVYMSINGDNITFVATDGHRLVRYQALEAPSNVNSSMILPRKAMNLLKTSLSYENNEVEVKYTSGNAFFKFDNIKMICRLIDERFPDYENVIPAENNNLMTIDRQEFLRSLRRVAIYANKTTHQIKIKILGSELHISAEDLDFSNEASEKLVCEHEGENIEIGFNGKFLVEMVNNIQGDKITMKFSDSNRASLLIPHDKSDKENLLMLVMPVILSH